MTYKPSISPQQDTGWGLIYRLNDLFRQIEVLAPSGKYDDWNFKLDRIWSNLCYRNPLKIEKNDSGEITSVEFEEEEFKIKEFLDKQIRKYKAEQIKIQQSVNEGEDYTKKKEWVIAKKKLYRAILLKEIWLRKYMQELGLYLKEIEHNPAGAMWGK